MKTGEVVEVRPVQKPSKTLETTVRHALKLAAKAQAKQLGNGSGPLQLEFGR